MALEIDGLAVLCAIAEAPEAFPAIRGDVTKAAHALVTKQLKAKSLDLAALRAVRNALGPQPLALIVDGLKDAEVKALVTRLDKHNPEIKDGAAVAHRRHLMALASDQDPAAAPAAAPREAAKAPAKAPAVKAPKPAAEAPAEAAHAAPRKGPGKATPAPADALASAAMAARPPRRPRQQE